MTAAFPYGFERDSTIAELHDRFDTLDSGAGSDEERSVAGRLRTVRSHGKLAFADLEDQSGRIQLFARLDILGEEELAGFVDLGVGDIVGATGEIVKTRRGELSVMVKSTSLLAPCQRPMPDNWHGLSDVETRYRQRYLDLLFNPNARRALEARSVANATIRSFLSERAFIEVETPLLQSIASGAVARPFVTHHNALDLDLYLRVAPELYLKRLLIGGLERVFELNRSFRNEGISTQHNPEFSMLEAYEAFVDYEVTMGLVEELVRAIAGAVTGGLEFESAEGPIDLAPKFRRTTIFEVIAERTGSDLRAAWESADQAVLVKSAEHAGVKVDAAWSPGKLLLEIFEAAGERSLIQPTFVMGFPKDVSPLAKDHRDVPGFTEHADLIIGGLEIAPIYSELNDPDEQKRRFEQQASVQASSGAEALIPDADFIEALAYGMPPAGGFGLGVDRLLMLLLGLPSIREVVMFPTLRPER